MARRCFFSFHYQRDVWRAQTVKNAWVTKPDREDAGFFDASAFESKKREGDDALKRFLRDAMKGSSVVTSLVGAETASRRWVRYELVHGFAQGKGLLGVRIHQLKNYAQQTDSPGVNVLACLGYELDEKRETLRFKEFLEGTWKWFSDLPSMKYSDFPYSLSSSNALLSSIYDVYDYVDDNGFSNMGSWIEAAAKKAGR